VLGTRGGIDAWAGAVLVARAPRRAPWATAARRIALGTCVLAGVGCGGLSNAGRSGPDASLPSGADADDDLVGADGSADAGGPPCFGTGPCPGDAAAPACSAISPLDCYVNTHCPNGGQTTIVGTVYDPAGRNPIANAVVYVPEDVNHLPPLATGTSTCVTCATTVSDYVTFAFTDAAGRFTLEGVPTGVNVPIVIQQGKWRRAMAVPKVADCGTTTLASSGDAQVRFPRNRSEGSLPQMALLTGGCDNVACLLTRIGVDPSEFTAPGAGGRVDVYQGLGATGTGAALSNGIAGDCTTAACPLWSSKQALEAYDDLFLGCECSEHDETKPASSLQAMHDWLGEGGWVFATHSQTTWFKNGPADVQSVAHWTSGPASGAAGPFTVNPTSPEGMSLGTWLGNLGAYSSGLLPIDPADVSTSVTTVAPTAIAWINDVSTAVDGGGALSGNVKAFSAETPVIPVDAGQFGLGCGAINVTDIHPGGGQAMQDVNADGSSSPASVPAACPAGPLSAAEEAFEYLLFNRSICVATKLEPPPPPPPGPDGG
jgi:hypothetical protein